MAADRPTAGAIPDPSPETFARTLARVSEMAVAYLRDLPRREAFRRPPEDVAERLLNAPLPQTGVSAEEILAHVEAEILPYSLGIGHPRWWGFVRASAHPVGMATELLATTMNSNCAGSAQIATHLELTVLRWLTELVGYRADAGGLLMSGGSAANFVALAAMRERHLPGTRARGIDARSERPAVYATREVHGCVNRAVELLGLGSDALRWVPVDADRRMDVTALARMIVEDRAAGAMPLCVVATAGTVNSGAVDPLADMAELARREGLWFHVDGAYGAIGAALPELAEQYRGLDLADSIVVDPHKWLYVPYEAGAVLVRDPETLHQAFATQADYLEVQDEDYFNGPLWFHERGPQLSRGFRALKVWAVMQHIGMEGYRELWRHDLATAAELRRRAEDHPRLELAPSTHLSVCCFRYVPAHGDPNAFNRVLLDRIHRDGRLFVSGTTLESTFYLRACIINFRSTLDDARVAVETVVELGAALEREG
ncbi:MAG: aminotransferase class V-fold PLP-dependent enzyme [Gemmatimonadota bacterium]|nr:MAG: aminotransferase class V-fold PLP-dependent enzyme [Gemmatimonadota bacterium]